MDVTVIEMSLAGSLQRSKQGWSRHPSSSKPPGGSSYDGLRGHFQSSGQCSTKPHLIHTVSLVQSFLWWPSFMQLKKRPYTMEGMGGDGGCWASHSCSKRSRRQRHHLAFRESWGCTQGTSPHPSSDLARELRLL